MGLMVFLLWVFLLRVEGSWGSFVLALVFLLRV